ncbi:hypothetical protein [Cedratvirus kamchatka]|uniref:Ankyrin repeat-containing protein n=1 Tax=Cedratvirus kamchatka TaxID=2716914 RepID=A0A6G8MY51_9VIRU|nr:hypothetical protein [Cedratvirus kamchatka]
MQMQQMPKEMVENVCSYLGGYSYVASMVPYLRSCVPGANKEDFLIDVYRRQDFALICEYDLFPTYKVVEECVSLVVKQENLTILSWLFEQSQGRLLKMIAKQAALFGSYLVFTWAHQKGCSINDEMVHSVIESGNIRLFKFIKGVYSSLRVLNCAYRALYSRNFRILPVILDQAENIDIDFELGVAGSQSLIENFSRFHELNPNLLLSGACLGLHKELVLWLKEKYNLTRLPSEDDLPLLKGCYVFLSENKSEEEKFDFLKFLDQHFTLDYVELTWDLSATNHISILRWCLSKQARLSREIFRIACRNSVEDMTYLDSLGYFRGDQSYYVDVTYAGKVENLTWLKKKRLPLSNALNRGRRYNAGAYMTDGSIIPCLEWFIKKGVKIPPRVWRECLYNQDMETFCWLLDKVDTSNRDTMEELSLYATSTDDFNLEVFTALLPYSDREKIREIIEEKKKTRPNYLLYEEAERR